MGNFHAAKFTAGMSTRTSSVTAARASTRHARLLRISSHHRHGGLLQQQAYTATPFSRRTLTSHKPLYTPARKHLISHRRHVAFSLGWLFSRCLAQVTPAHLRLCHRRRTSLQQNHQRKWPRPCPLQPTGHRIPVPAPYNLCWTPDRTRAIVMAERLDRIDFYALIFKVTDGIIDALNQWQARPLDAIYAGVFTFGITANAVPVRGSTTKPAAPTMIARSVSATPALKQPPLNRRLQDRIGFRYSYVGPRQQRSQRQWLGLTDHISDSAKRSSRSHFSDASHDDDRPNSSAERKALRIDD